MRIVNEFIEKKELIVKHLEDSSLSLQAKEIYKYNLFDRLTRIR